MPGQWGGGNGKPLFMFFVLQDGNIPEVSYTAMHIYLAPPKLYVCLDMMRMIPVFYYNLKTVGKNVWYSHLSPSLPTDSSWRTSGSSHVHPLYCGPPATVFPCVQEAIHIPETALKLCLSPACTLQSSSLNSRLNSTPSLVHSTQHTFPSLSNLWMLNWKQTLARLFCRIPRTVCAHAPSPP